MSGGESDISAVVSVSRFDFDQQGRLDYAYTLKPNGYSMSCNSSGVMSMDWDYPRVPLPDVFGEDPIPVPPLCPSYPPDESLSQWRTFDPVSLARFREQDGAGRRIDFLPPEISDAENIPIPKSVLDEKGFLWVGCPTVALALGISRALVQDTPATLIGFASCACNLDANGKAVVIYPRGDGLRGEIIRRENITRRSNLGTVVERITPEQIAQGVVFEVDTRYFQPLLQHIHDPDWRQSVPQSLEQLFTALCDLLDDVGRLDPEADDFNEDYLPRSWGHFLHPINAAQVMAI